MSASGDATTLTAMRARWMRVHPLLRLLVSMSVLVGAAALIVGVVRGSSPSDLDRAKKWVTSNGGTLGVPGSGWSASQDDWKGAWPWPAASVEVGCAPDLYDGTTYVQIGGDLYWLEATNGYPPDGGTYKAPAVSIGSDEAAEIEWAESSLTICGIGSS